MSQPDPIEDAVADLSSASEGELARRAAEDDEDLRWLIANFRGRRFLRRQLERAGVFRSSFTGDALTAAFAEGERNGGLRLFSQIVRVAPARVAELLTEEKSDG